MLLSGRLAAVAVMMIAAFPVVAMALRFRSLAIGLYSVVAWQVFAIGFWPGFLRRRIAPTAWIASAVLQDPLDVRRFRTTPAAR
jgi:hypothetical protein